ncbi:replication initiator protein [Sigmofec virus UA08Rod_6110]|uniref:Replication initiator protein n=1 Tax=Sigmofec virus UA08Rod_6110 TaxID=2929452 RepID=A0A976N0H6_9VIRU|nr:replication initiator protein [Sigmofec virus UA08Rod_6110]
MVCYHPIRAYWSKKPHPSTGNKYLVFNPSQARTTDFMTVPCGKCEGCLLDKSFAWSVRCTLESQFHRENYFLTLTYDKKHLPSDGLLNRVHVQQFLKRLRKRFSDYKLRVFYCGEYGEARHRPHYHLIVFGLPLSELNYRLYKLSCSKKGNINYYNPIITDIWGKGICTIGSFSSASASYVAQYTMKKNKENLKIASHNHRSRRFSVGRPFIGMSNRPAIGQQFFDKYYKQIFQRESFKVDLGKSVVTVRPLRFFVTQLKKKDPCMYFHCITRPMRRRMIENRRLALYSPDEFSSRIDKKIRNVMIKEERTLRKLEARLDL